jgi:hypothetical protein
MGLFSLVSFALCVRDEVQRILVKAAEPTGQGRILDVLSMRLFECTFNVSGLCFMKKDHHHHQ